MARKKVGYKMLRRSDQTKLAFPCGIFGASHDEVALLLAVNLLYSRNRHERGASTRWLKEGRGSAHGGGRGGGQNHTMDYYLIHTEGGGHMLLLYYTRTNGRN
jgi:hypothetical protein